MKKINSKSSFSYRKNSRDKDNSKTSQGVTTRSQTNYMLRDKIVSIGLVNQAYEKKDRV